MSENLKNIVYVESNFFKHWTVVLHPHYTVRPYSTNIH